MSSISRRRAWQGLAALAAVSQASTPVHAQPAKPRFCGGTAIEWAADVARSATDRLGNKLSFGQPLATLDYSNDLFAISLLRLAGRANNVALRAYGEDIVGSFVADDGSIKRVPERGFRLDAMPAGVVLIDIYQRTREEKYRKAAAVMRERLAALPRTSEGTFAWAPNQIWLDGLWMTEPFYARYAQAFDQPADYDDILRQYKATVAHNRDPRTGLYYHGWDERRELFWANRDTGTSSSFWARAMGWFAMSLVDTLDSVTATHPLHAFLVQTLRDLAPAIVRVQDPKSGLWWQVLDQGERAGNYTEASASAIYTYTLAKGVNRATWARRSRRRRSAASLVVTIASVAIVHPSVDEEVRCPFCHRSSDTQARTISFGVIDEPVALALEIGIDFV